MYSFYIFYWWCEASVGGYFDYIKSTFIFRGFSSEELFADFAGTIFFFENAVMKLLKVNEKLSLQCGNGSADTGQKKNHTSFKAFVIRLKKYKCYQYMSSYQNHRH